MNALEEARGFWKIASEFPGDKEAAGVYGQEHTDAMRFRKVGRVLEYGCGGGSDTLSWVRRGNCVDFVDIVLENVETTRSRVRETFPTKTNDAGTVLERSDVLPFDNESFNLVSSHGVIHHIPEPLPVLEEFYRVLKRGGAVVLMLYTEHLRAEHDERVRSLMADGMSEEFAFGMCTDGGGYAESYTFERGQELLEAAGFKLESAVVYHKKLFRAFHGVKP